MLSMHVGLPAGLSPVLVYAFTAALGQCLGWQAWAACRVETSEAAQRWCVTEMWRETRRRSGALPTVRVPLASAGCSLCQLMFSRLASSFPAPLDW